MRGRLPFDHTALGLQRPVVTDHYYDKQTLCTTHNVVSHRFLKHV